jgi:hypothetical protein
MTVDAAHSLVGEAFKLVVTIEAFLVFYRSRCRDRQKEDKESRHQGGIPSVVAVPMHRTDVIPSNGPVN